MSDDLVEFLRARLDEDEAIANSAMGIWKDDGAGNIADASYMARLAIGPVGNPIDAASRTHILHHQPARVLREVAAKRAILGAYESQRAARFNDPAVVDELRDVTQTLASVYSGHPDYRQEWKP